MARKPNYRFERQERDRKKAAKKEAKAKAKAEKSEQPGTGSDDPSHGAAEGREP